MNHNFESTRDIIIRTENWDDAVAFYGKTMGLPETYRSRTLVGFDTGAIQLFVEKGPQHGPVFEFLVADVQAAKHALLAARCKVVEEDATVPRCYLRDPYGVVFNLGQSRQ